VLLGQLTLQALEDDGYRIVDRTGLGDGVAVRRALVAGNVDVAWEYTGTAWATHLGHDQPMPDPQELYMRLRAEDLPRGITWLPPTSCRQRTGIVMREAVAEAAAIYTVGELVTHMTVKSADPGFCVASDLVEAMNGLRGLRLVYGWALGTSRTRAAPEEETLRALRQDECQAALVTDADGAAAAADLVHLRDDRSLFGASDLAAVVRTDSLHQYPMLEARLSQIATALTQARLLELEESIRRGAKPRSTARRFLSDSHLIGRNRATAQPTPSPWPTVTPGPTFTAMPTTEAVRTATPSSSTRSP
jgi:osmoprotectant transport system substrate-binding protein